MSFADHVQALRLRKLKILDDHRKKSQKLQRALDRDLSMIDEVLTQLANTSDQLPCLVRTTPGPELTIYHSADAPCGRVHSRRNFAVMPEAKAMDASPYAYLERCTACKWEQAAKVHGNRAMADA
ncbi:hypothetical protein ACFU53_24655 [Streptomyces sp. NPDC057474]|uniref:hypothetical protein n=1 Tax=Streptomyces sp. NPDC057474 TaxID=3346144 RepID=UPI00369B58A0